MTQGEKMIWASMFANSLHRSFHKHEAIGLSTTIHQKVLLAAKLAHSAVELVRAEVDNVEEATHISIANMMREMSPDGHRCECGGLIDGPGLCPECAYKKMRSGKC